MKDVKWGFIGCGNVTEVKSGPAFARIDHSSVVAVMRRDEERGWDYADRHGIGKCYTNAAHLVNDPEVNAVYVATPPAFHAEYAIMAARAGKHVYVEKPMALNYSQCREMIVEAEKAGVMLFVAYYRRSLAYFRKIKEILDSGGIGEVRTAHIKLFKPVAPEVFEQDPLPWRYDPEISGGGLLVDLGCHQLDLLDFLLGPVTEVKAMAGNWVKRYPVEDVVSACFKFDSGVLATASWNFTVPEELHQEEVEIVGSSGRLRFSTFDFNPIYWNSETRKEVFDFTRPQHIQQDLIRSVVEALLGKGTCPSMGESAARTNRVLDQILAPFYQSPPG